MKTGYDQHFKKVKQTVKAPGVNVRALNSAPAVASTKKEKVVGLDNKKGNRMIF